MDGAKIVFETVWGMVGHFTHMNFGDFHMKGILCD
jgi:hypothetical protein